MSLELTIVKRKNCESFSKGHCSFYQIDCFHEDSNPDTSRCYKLIPRTEEEFMDLDE